MTKTQSVIRRFIKGFIAGGLASTSMVLAGGITLTSIEDIKSLSYSLILAFITGGILALEKMLNWQPVSHV